MEEKYTRFDKLSGDNVGEEFNFHGRVEVVKQTAGPTLMVISDGTRSFTFKAFIKPGVRAYPEIEEGSYVKGIATLYQRNEEIEGEIKEINAMGEKEIEEFKEKHKEKLEKLAFPEIENFSIKSEVLESLRENFLKVATQVRKAIFESRPIILRHNADCDGYVSAISLEKAILELLREYSSGDSNMEHSLFKRAPSKAPFYEYEDALKDAMGVLMSKHTKEPLIIITDNGSTEEDVVAMEQMRIYGCEIVVVDHHYPGEVKEGKALVDNYIKGHVNPYLKGYDSNVTAGMLGFELARFINNKVSINNLLPALAGYADHSEGEEVNKYLEKAYQEGFSKDYIERLAEVLDFEIHNLRFFEGREFVQDLFFNIENQKKIVNLLHDMISKRYENFKHVVEKYAKVEKAGNINIVTLNGEKAVNRGEYPAIGKLTNFMHRYFEEKLGGNVITAMYGSSFMTLRVSDGITSFTVPEFVKVIERDYQHANPSGGGHEHAGSLKFIEYGKKEILNALKDYVRNLK